MVKLNDIPHNNEELKDLEHYLRSHDLIDDRNMWFAGFPYTEGAGQNAIARNLFYGNKLLKVIAVKGEEILYLHNAKNHFNVYKYGLTTETYDIIVKRKIMHPTIEMKNSEDERISLQIKFNKDKVFEFKKLIK